MSIYLRKASMDDAERILAWRNDETARAYSFTKDKIDIDTHRKWLKDKLDSENCSLFILMDDQEPVGQVRIDKIKDVGEVSYTIAPERRRMGYGTKIIRLCEDAVPEGVRALVGLVEKENEASKKCFLNNGYVAFAGGDIQCFVKVLG